MISSSQTPSSSWMSAIVTPVRSFPCEQWMSSGRFVGSAMIRSAVQICPPAARSIWRYKLATPLLLISEMTSDVAFRLNHGTTNPIRPNMTTTIRRGHVSCFSAEDCICFGDKYGMLTRHSCPSGRSPFSKSADGRCSKRVCRMRSPRSPLASWFVRTVAKTISPQ